MTESHLERLRARARELEAEGLGWVHALGIAELEESVLHWPAGWGDDFIVLLYGDFEAPKSALTYPSLGITVHPEKLTDTVIRGALTVLKATVKVQEKSVPAVIDAAKRINLLLGAYTLHEWGNGPIRWWSYITHSGGGGVQITLDHDGIERSTAAILSLPEDARGHVEAALFWVREPRNLLLEHHRPDTLRIYSSYWNAFECLVRAVNKLRPRSKASDDERQAQIDLFFQKRGGELTPKNIQDCFRQIVDPGLRGQAAHALSVCFGQDGKRYFDECFQLSDRRNQLYDIRNAINHGNIDAEDPRELVRVEAGLPRLWMIVWGMFGRLIPFPAPVDPEVSSSPSNAS